MISARSVCFSGPICRSFCRRLRISQFAFICDFLTSLTEGFSPAYQRKFQLTPDCYEKFHDPSVCSCCLKDFGEIFFSVGGCWGVMEVGHLPGGGRAGKVLEEGGSFGSDSPPRQWRGAHEFRPERLICFAQPEGVSCAVRRGVGGCTAISQFCPVSCQRSPESPEGPGRVLALMI